LDYLESRRWETQPLTADLIYRLLADALGDTPGLALYEDLGEAVLQICANPLLLTMVLTVYQATGKAPVGRGALYRQFVERFLGWGEERGLGVDEREALDALLPEHLTKACYQALAEEVLTTLAAAMIRSASRASWSSCAASCI
jgi:predicted NACHT family NTPase